MKLADIEELREKLNSLEESIDDLPSEKDFEELETLVDEEMLGGRRQGWHKYSEGV